jgi:hypothetical protein
MDSDDIVAVAVVCGGTAVGVADLAIHGDGVVLTAMIAVYTLVLGYVFGKAKQATASVQAPT